VIKSREVRWAGHAARIGEMRNVYTDLEGKDHLEDLGVDGKIGLEHILDKSVDCIHMDQDRGK
jgi:hypothetical protein